MADHAPYAGRRAKLRSLSHRPLVALIVVVQLLWIVALGWVLLTTVT